MDFCDDNMDIFEPPLLQPIDQKRSTGNFYRPETPSYSRDLYVIGCGHEKCTWAYRVNRDRKCPFYALEFVLEGKGTFFSEELHVDLSSGDLFSYGTGFAHGYRADRSAPFEKFWISFAGQRARELLEESMGAVGAVRTTTDTAIMQAIFADSVREAAAGESSSWQIIDHYLSILLYKLSDSRRGGSVENDPGRIRYLACRRMIESGYETMKSPYELLPLLHLSASYLCRLFKKYSGKSPYEFLMKLKMNRAAHLLLTTSHSVKYIAGQVQFEDPLHFSRVFRRFYGKAPREYRRS
jgi:AraC-like DNA-binding protein